jgi:hypothetical protein
LRNALAPRLVVGEYRIEASTDTGLTAQAALKVDSLALSSDVLVLHLR